jgi:hypothetical protein
LAQAEERKWEVRMKSILRQIGTRWIPGFIAVVALFGTPALPTSGAVTRTFSCPGWTFMPFADGPYSMIGNSRVISAGRVDAQSTIFACNASLPHGATVTNVSFMLVDWSAYAEVRDCKLLRTGLQPGYTQGGSLDVLASVPATGVAAKPGDVRYTDTSIINAKVNNNRYGYVLRCTVDPSGGGPDVPWAGLYGASIVYTTG